MWMEPASGKDMDTTKYTVGDPKRSTMNFVGILLWIWLRNDDRRLGRRKISIKTTKRRLRLMCLYSSGKYMCPKRYKYCSYPFEYWKEFHNERAKRMTRVSWEVTAQNFIWERSGRCANPPCMVCLWYCRVLFINGNFSGDNWTRSSLFQSTLHTTYYHK